MARELFADLSLGIGHNGDGKQQQSEPFSAQNVLPRPPQQPNHYAHQPSSARSLTSVSSKEVTPRSGTTPRRTPSFDPAAFSSVRPRTAPIPTYSARRNVDYNVLQAGVAPLYGSLVSRSTESSRRILDRATTSTRNKSRDRQTVNRSLNTKWNFTTETHTMCTHPPGVGYDNSARPLVKKSVAAPSCSTSARFLKLGARHLSASLCLPDLAVYARAAADFALLPAEYMSIQHVVKVQFEAQKAAVCSEASPDTLVEQLEKTVFSEHARIFGWDQRLLCDLEHVVLLDNVYALEFIAQGKPKTAMGMLMKAEEFTRTGQSHCMPNRLLLRICTLINLAYYFSSRKKPNAALQYVERAMTAVKSDDAKHRCRHLLPSLYICYGAVLLDVGQLDPACSASLEGVKRAAKIGFDIDNFRVQPRSHGERHTVSHKAPPSPRASSREHSESPPPARPGRAEAGPGMAARTSEQAGAELALSASAQHEAAEEEEAADHMYDSGNDTVRRVRPTHGADGGECGSRAECEEEEDEGLSAAPWKPEDGSGVVRVLETLEESSVLTPRSPADNPVGEDGGRKAPSLPSEASSETTHERPTSTCSDTPQSDREAASSSQQADRPSSAPSDNRRRRQREAIARKASSQNSGREKFPGQLQQLRLKAGPAAEGSPGCERLEFSGDDNDDEDDGENDDDEFALARSLNEGNTVRSDPNTLPAPTSRSQVIASILMAVGLYNLGVSQNKQMKPEKAIHSFEQSYEFARLHLSPGNSLMVQAMKALVATDKVLGFHESRLRQYESPFTWANRELQSVFAGVMAEAAAAATETHSHSHSHGSATHTPRMTSPPKPRPPRGPKIQFASKASQQLIDSHLQPFQQPPPPTKQRIKPSL